MEFTLDISMDSHFMRANLNSIPLDCTKLCIKGTFLKPDMRNGKQVLIGDTNLSPYRLNEKMKFLKELKILDLSGCEEINHIFNGFRDLSIETLILPPKVKILPSIYNCANLRNIIGIGLTEIPNVSRCPLLEHLEFSPLLNYIHIPNTSVRSLNLPNVTELQCDAFENCKNLISIQFSSNLKKISRGSFRNCEQLYSLTIPDSCTEIDNNAFDGCISLMTVYLPNNLYSLKEDTFANCKSLKYLHGGRSISDLKKGAFFNCVSLKKLPFVPKNIDDETFENITNNLYGIVLSTTDTSIIWCFNNFQFYHCIEKLNYDDKNKIVTFSSFSRYSIKQKASSLLIDRNLCQLATQVNKSFSFDDIPYNLRDAIIKLNNLPDRIPEVDKIFNIFKSHVRSLDINSIISSYNTSASEFQTWKVGGDNTFYHSVKTSIDYSDCYIESLLPTIDEEYSESACYNFEDDINHNIQANYRESDKQLKKDALVKYDQEQHIEDLVNDYIQSYVQDKLFIEDTLRVEFAKNIVSYYFKYLYKHYKLILSLSILCDNCTPDLDYEHWLRMRYDNLFE